MPGTTADQKRQLAWNIIREVSLHSTKEEEVRRGQAAAAAAAGKTSMQEVCMHLSVTYSAEVNAS
jgi:hypothetical protein